MRDKRVNLLGVGFAIFLLFPFMMAQWVGNKIDSIFFVGIMQLKTNPGSGAAARVTLNGYNSLEFTDGEDSLTDFIVPANWDEESDFTLYIYTALSVAEDVGDTISFTTQISSHGDGDTLVDAGQTPACTLNIPTGGNGQYAVNLLTCTIDYDNGTYPVQLNDVVTIKVTANVGGGGEISNAIHIIAWYVSYNAIIAKI